MAIGDEWPDDAAVPAVSSPGTGYASGVNAVLEEAIARLTEPIPASGLAWTSDVSLDNRGLENCAFIGLYDQSALSDEVGHIQSYSGELYFISSAGAVQITSGGSLDAAGLGGIVGDYGGGNPARVSFVDASSTYEFYDDLAGGDWANIRAARLILDSTGSTATATIDFTGSANYTLTLPTAVPAGTALLAMESDGDVVHNQTVTVSPTFSADLILSGTAKIQHGTRTIAVAVPQFPSTSRLTYTAPNALDAEYTFGAWRALNNNAVNLNFIMPALPVGSRLTNVALKVFQDANAPSWTLTVYSATLTTNVRNESSIGTTTFDLVGLPASDRNISLNVTDTLYTSTGSQRFIVLVGVPAAQQGIIQGFTLSYDTPA